MALYIVMFRAGHLARALPPPRDCESTCIRKNASESYLVPRLNPSMLIAKRNVNVK